MHLQQTKRSSRDTGGPQYYFHNLSGPIKSFLRQKGAVRVALVTPYGATKTDFFAVGKDHKLDKAGRIIRGKVGHDRIQQGEASESIGESIRYWYNLPKGDFERIDIDIDIIDEYFYLTPLKYKMVNSKRDKLIKRINHPLTFSTDYVSRLWKEQLRQLLDIDKNIVYWSFNEICRVVSAHREKVRYVKEEDLLRVSGPLKHLGISLGPYVGKGHDCYSEIKFLDYPLYKVNIEIKKNSKDFNYQMKKYKKEELSRVIILCIFNDLPNPPKNIDILELDFMCNYGQNL